MKIHLRKSIALLGAVCLACVLNCHAVLAADAVVSDLESSYAPETGTLLVSGSAPGADAVAITVLDNQDNLILFGSALVSNDTFNFDTANLPDSDPIWVSLTDGEYEIRVADYEGGDYTENSLAVDTEAELPPAEEAETETLAPLDTPDLGAEADSKLLTGTGMDTITVNALICLTTLSYASGLMIKRKYLRR